MYILNTSSKLGFNMDYSKLPTPPTCVADFCLIPVRPPLTSVLLALVGNTLLDAFILLNISSSLLIELLDWHRLPLGLQ